MAWLLHVFSRAIVVIVALPAVTGMGGLSATDGLVLLQQRASQRGAQNAQRPVLDLFRFIRSKAQTTLPGSARVSPNRTSVGHMSDAAAQTSPAENLSLDQQTQGTGWCDYQTKEGWATLYVDPADPMSFLVDLTNAMKQSKDGSVKMLVTAMATKGLFLDDYGQIVTLHEPLEQTEHNLLEMKATDDGFYVDVLQPQLDLRTSDPQEEEALEMGVPSKLWQASMERLYCTGQDAGDNYYGGDDYNYDYHRTNDAEEQKESLKPKASFAQTKNTKERFQSRREASVTSESKVADPIVFDGIELLARGFFVSQGLIEGVSDYRLLSVKSFPNNFDVTVELRYEAQDASIPSFPLTVTFSVTALPDTPMAPRLGDERLGYFTTNYKDLGRHKERGDQTRSEARDTDMSMIWRYDLGRIGNEIRFHIDPTVPPRYRKCFRDGIEAWNEAFELLGNASATPKVKGVAPGDAQWPQDYDAGDARFNTISWSIHEDAVFSEGIAKVDQRSGEIMKADIIMTGGWVRAWMGEFDRFTPTHHTQHMRRGYRREFLRLRELSDVSPNHNDSALGAKRLKGLRRKNSTRGHEALLARARAISSSVPLKGRKQEEEVLCDGLKDVVMHEMGHVLGLRHNFKGSLGVKWSCVQNMTCSAEQGLSTSVMDYLPTNVPAEGIENVHLFSPKIGAYDILAIKYGYATFDDDAIDGIPHLTPELKGLLTEAEAYPTCTDGEIDGLDPGCAMYDLSSEPVTYYADQLRLVKISQQQLFESAVAPGESYTRYGDAAQRLISEVAFIGSRLIGFIGGYSMRRSYRHVDGRRGHPAVRPINPFVQRKALNLTLHLLRPNQARLTPPAMNENFLVQSGDWEGVERLDVQGLVEELQTLLIRQLLDPQRLRRLPLMGTQQVATEESAAAPEEGSTLSLTAGELLNTLGGAVWGESEEGQDEVTQLEGWNLQTTYVRSLHSLIDLSQSTSLTSPSMSIGAASQAFYALSRSKDIVQERLKAHGETPSWTGQAGSPPAVHDLQTSFLWQLKALLEQDTRLPPEVVTTGISPDEEQNRNPGSSFLR